MVPGARRRWHLQLHNDLPTRDQQDPMDDFVLAANTCSLALVDAPDLPTWQEVTGDVWNMSQLAMVEAYRNGVETIIEQLVIEEEPGVERATEMLADVRRTREQIGKRGVAHRAVIGHWVLYGKVAKLDEAIG